MKPKHDKRVCAHSYCNTCSISNVIYVLFFGGGGCFGVLGVHECYF